VVLADIADTGFVQPAKGVVMFHHEAGEERYIYIYIRTSLGDPTSLQVELRKAQVALEALGYDRRPSVPDLV
jgi:hypothetical protein